MDNVVGRLVYKITGDTSLLNTSLKNARAEVKATGESFDKLSKQVLNFSTKVLSGVLIKKLADAASRLEELDSKFNTVFSGIEAETNAWVKTYADATARGVIATKEFLATQQDLRTGYGDTTERAAEFSKVVVGLTNDLASFSNINVTDAMQAVNSLLAKQFEAGRRLGIGITVDIINQSNYAKALNKTWLEMSNLEQQEAIISVALSQSKNAIHQNIDSWEDYNYRLGDAAKTSSSYANSTQDLKQTLEDAAASLGTVVLPTVTNLVQTGTEILDIVIAAPKPIKTLATSVGILGVSLKTLGGPVGAVVGSFGILVNLFNSADTSFDKLKRSTDNLALSTEKYKELTKVLQGNTEDLTKSQLALYEAQRKMARADALKNLKDISKAYSSSAKDVNVAKEAWENNQAYFDAYTVAVEKGMPGVIEALESSYESGEKAQKIYFSVLNDLKNLDWLFEDAANQANMYADGLDDFKSQFLLAEGEMESSVYSLVHSVLSGILSIEDLIGVDKNLKNAVIEIVESQKNQADSSFGVSTATETATSFTQEYITKLKELKAELKEEEGLYVQSAAMKLALSKEAEEAAIRDLAVRNNLIQEGENVEEISISSLKKRIKKTEEGNDELLALQEYFKLQREAIEKEMTESLAEVKEKELTANKNWTEKLLSQTREMKEEEASLYLNNDEIEKAYEIKFELLEEEKKLALENLQEQIKNKEATEADIALIEEYYKGESERLNKEKNNAIFELETERIAEEERLYKEQEAERERNAEKYSSILIRQSRDIDDATATELISLGKVEEGYKIKIDLIEKERDSEREKLEEKIANNEATTDDLINFEKYYSNEIVRINNEMNDKIFDLANEEAEKEAKRQKELADERKKNALKYEEFLIEQKKNIQEASAEELISLGKIEDGYKIKKKLLEEQKDEELKALKEKVDREEATEEDIKNLKKYYKNEAIALNDEMNDAIEKRNQEAAEAEKEKWLSVAEELVSTIQSIYGSLLDISANQTNAEIALIKKQQQAQFEALGIAEETEKEKLQRELKEAQEKGEQETAVEKEKALMRLKIEEDNQKKIDKLNYEQAKKEKELAIFNATIAMLTAVIKAFANPGGWPGVALSGLALATGIAQIAAIQSQPLPEYASGTTEITEDHIARVHQGEIIVPKTFSEGIRNGDVTLGENGGTVVNIVVNNTAGVNVEAESRKNEKGETDVIIAVTKVVNSQIQKGAFDSSLTSRYGIKRMGING